MSFRGGAQLVEGSKATDRSGFWEGGSLWVEVSAYQWACGHLAVRGGCLGAHNWAQRGGPPF